MTPTYTQHGTQRRSVSILVRARAEHIYDLVTDIS